MSDPKIAAFTSNAGGQIPDRDVSTDSSLFDNLSRVQPNRALLVVGRPMPIIGGKCQSKSDRG
jgi:hypothetical protein